MKDIPSCGNLISVIVPIYNVEPFLEQCIISIVNQTYKNLEIILVDDESPDNCPKICDEWAKKDSRIKVIHKKNGGLSDARNAGMRIATGDIISFVDSDDWLDDHFYDVLIKEMQDNNCDIISCGFIKTEDRSCKDAQIGEKKTLLFNNSEAMAQLINENAIKQVVWNKLYKRELVLDIPFEVGKCNEDDFWSYQIIGKASCVGVVDYSGYYYFQRPNSIMGSGFSKKRLDGLKARAIRQEYLENHYPQLAGRGLSILHGTGIFMGQMALKSMTKPESDEAIKEIQDIISNHPLSFKAIFSQEMNEMVWLLLEKISFKLVCRIKNKLNVGF